MSLEQLRRCIVINLFIQLFPCTVGDIKYDLIFGYLFILEYLELIRLAMRQPELVRVAILSALVVKAATYY